MNDPTISAAARARLWRLFHAAARRGYECGRDADRESRETDLSVAARRAFEEAAAYIAALERRVAS